MSLHPAASHHAWLYRADLRGPCEALHLVPLAADTEWRNGTVEWKHRHATAACGAQGEWTIPGMFSRSGLIRCSRCAATVGVARAHGTPLNERYRCASAVETCDVFDFVCALNRDEENDS